MAVGRHLTYEQPNKLNMHAQFNNENNETELRNVRPPGLNSVQNPMVKCGGRSFWSHSREHHPN